MYCGNCGKKTDEKKSVNCQHCGFDLTPFIRLLNVADDDDDDLEDKVRTADEIAKRALIVSTVVACAYDHSKKKNEVGWLKKEKLWDHVSPDEKKFLLSAKENKKKEIFYSWKVETLVPLLWSIGKLKNLQRLNEQCNIPEIKKAMVFSPDPADHFIRSAVLLSEKKILKEYDKVYDAHWKVVDAKLHNKKIPKGYNPEVIYERHYGFNWLTGYMGQDWDDITTDT